ncbi:thiamine biosynthesis lipoprotein ApbE precursor [mine drainage metagenome]|uniref:FAD:protein FMN transferase n=1 Tax=mine drainage metagenome TaxID=410659 RepID=A0A1J5RET1_9ZZZZ
MDTLVSPRRRALVQALGAASLLSACGGSRASRVSPAAEFSGLTMGSAYTVKIAGAALSPALRAVARNAVGVALGAVDIAMSTFRPQSELSRFNAHASTSPFTLSPDTFSVFALAQQVSAATSGAFDVTVGPAVDAWGFGPGRRERIVEGPEVAALEHRVGWRKLRLDENAGTVAKLRPEVRADLSGIAKGYGVDKAAQALDALGIEHYLIDAGGEVRTRGRNPEGRPWQVAIEQPEAGARRPRYIVPLSGLAIATSGDYRIYFERDGRRYCHEIDPATGRPIDNRLASVSVVAATGALADAMGKLIVLGPERAYACATKQGIAAHFIVREAAGGLRDLVTPAFAALGGTPFRA